MNAKEFLRKYGVWIAGGALLVYLVLKNAAGGRPGANAGTSTNALELAKLQAASAQAAGQQDVERARIAAELEAAKSRTAADAAARAGTLALQDEALNIQAAQQSQGALASILGAIGNIASNILKGATQARGGGSSGGGGASSPSPAPSRSGGGYRVPEPNLGPSIFNPPYVPDYPEPILSNTFSEPNITFDSGLTFFDQIPEPNLGSYFPSSTDYSALPEPIISNQFEPPMQVESQLPVISTDWSDYYDVPTGGGGNVYDYYGTEEVA